MANISGYLKSLVSSLATVATSGSYTDLTNKPSLATVATSGSYTDLTNKPIQQSGKKILLSNNSTNPNTQIDFSEGVYDFSDGSSSANFPAITKRLDANWAVGTNQGGLDTGTKASSTWYHCYAIYNPTTLISDAIFSINATIPTLPIGYTKYNLIESVYVNSSGNILGFKDLGDRIRFNTFISEFNAAPGTTLQTLTIRAPLGRVVKSLLNIRVIVGCQSGDSGIELFSGNGITETLNTVHGALGTGGNLGASINTEVETNLLSQIKYKGFNTVASCQILNFGWLKN